MKLTSDAFKQIGYAAIALLLLAVVIAYIPSEIRSDFQILIAGISSDKLLKLSVIPATGLVFVLFRSRIRFTRFNFNSKIVNHEGPCLPVWVNKNQIDYMTSGAVTGFFKRAYRVAGLPLVILVGAEFHGYVRGDEVRGTFGAYGRLPN